MATYDLEEQENLENLKTWWKRWGNAVLLVLALALMAGAGWQYWQRHQEAQRIEGAQVYGQFLEALTAGNAALVREVGGRLIDKFADTPYAPRAALILGKFNVERGDEKSADAQFKWALDHSREPVVKDLARLHLGGLLLQQKQYEQALKVLNAPHTDAYNARFEDLKGDVLLAQGKTAEAKAAYQAAYAKLAKTDPLHGVVGVKLDALGGPAQ